MSTKQREADRVRRHTPPASLDKIEQKLEQNVRFHGSRQEGEITQRITELNNEWSMERTLETNASIVALTGAVLGIALSRKWLLLSAGVGWFLVQHAISGWCPPVPLFRRYGVRTRGEIDREKFALKAIRGDFKDIPDRPPQGATPGAAVESARA